MAALLLVAVAACSDGGDDAADRRPPTAERDDVGDAAPRRPRRPTGAGPLRSATLPAAPTAGSSRSSVPDLDGDDVVDEASLLPWAPTAGGPSTSEPRRWRPGPGGAVHRRVRQRFDGRHRPGPRRRRRRACSSSSATAPRPRSTASTTSTAATCAVPARRRHAGRACRRRLRRRAPRLLRARRRRPHRARRHVRGRRSTTSLNERTYEVAGGVLTETAPVGNALTTGSPISPSSASSAADYIAPWVVAACPGAARGCSSVWWPGLLTPPVAAPGCPRADLQKVLGHQRAAAVHLAGRDRCPLCGGRGRAARPPEVDPPPPATTERHGAGVDLGLRWPSSASARGRAGTTSGGVEQGQGAVVPNWASCRASKLATGPGRWWRLRRRCLAVARVRAVEVVLQGAEAAEGFGRVTMLLCAPRRVAGATRATSVPVRRRTSKAGLAHALGDGLYLLAPV